MPRQSDIWRWYIRAALLLLVMGLFVFPAMGSVGAQLWSWLWILLAVCGLGLMFLLRPRPGDVLTGEPAPAGPRVVPPEEQPPVLREVMDVRVATEFNGVRAYRGTLSVTPEEAYDRVSAVAGDRVIPLVQEDPELGAAVVLMPKRVEEQTMERPSRPLINWLLFAATIVTTTVAGARHQGVDLMADPARFTVGLPYALGLMAILGLHELGHYLVARYHGINVSPPYFIPVPFALGTFGAFIQMKSPTPTRKALFDVAVAGPLAGLVVAIPALLIGLRSSTLLLPGGEGHAAINGTSVTSSVLLALVAKLSIGESLQYGHYLQLSPLAFAGWLGLFVTALNLLPIGQLDGGHIARSMLGTQWGLAISKTAMWSLFLLAIFFWPGLLMWALIIFFIAGRPTPPLNDLTPISPGRRALGYVAFLILALIICPLPEGLWTGMGIRCPYL